MHDVVCLSRETTDKAADIGCCSTDVDHHRIRETCQKGCATHRVRRAGCEAVNRVCSSNIGECNSAVILCEVKWRCNACFGQGIGKRLNGRLAERLQGRVEKRHVLALE